MSHRRIVITGMGAVSPLGCGVEAIWQRLLKGESGIRALPDEIVADLPVKVEARFLRWRKMLKQASIPTHLSRPKTKRKWIASSFSPWWRRMKPFAVPAG